MVLTLNSGGGIGGLAFAVALSKMVGSAVDVDIYESTGSFSEVGAGLGVWPRVWAAMKILGLEDDLHNEATALADGTRGLHFRMSH